MNTARGSTANSDPAMQAGVNDGHQAGMDAAKTQTDPTAPDGVPVQSDRWWLDPALAQLAFGSSTSHS